MISFVTDSLIDGNLMQNFQHLDCLCCCAGPFVSDLVRNPSYRFSSEAHTSEIFEKILQKENIRSITIVLEPSIDIADFLPPSPRHLSELSRANEGGGRNGGITGFRVSVLILV